MTPDQLSKLQEKKELFKAKRIAKKSEQHKIDSPSDESSDEGSEVEVADGENSNKEEINMEKDIDSLVEARLPTKFGNFKLGLEIQTK